MGGWEGEGEWYVHGGGKKRPTATASVVILYICVKTNNINDERLWQWLLLGGLPR